MVSARIYLHPRVAVEGPAFAALAAHLHERGISLEGLAAYKPTCRRDAGELVRKVAEAGALITYERMDGTRFNHSTATGAPMPGTA